MITPVWLSPHLWRLRDSLLKGIQGDKSHAWRWEAVASLVTFVLDSLLAAAIASVLWGLFAIGWGGLTAVLAFVVAGSAVRWYGESSTGVLLRPLGAWWRHRLCPELSVHQQAHRISKLMTRTPWPEHVRTQWCVHEFWGALALWAADPELRAAALAAEIKQAAPVTQTACSQRRRI